MARTRIPRTLDALLDVLQGAPSTKNDGAAARYGERYGLPTAHGEIDTTDLPTYGGTEPIDTDGVWSWDATRLLVGTCADDFEIIPRPED